MYKEVVNIPKASLFFINRIKQRLIEKNWDKNSYKNEIIVVVTKDFPYSDKVISPIERYFSKNGWKFSMKRYSRGEKFFSYAFIYEKKCVIK